MAIGWLHDLGNLDKIKDPEEIKRRALEKGYNNRGRSGIKQALEFYLDVSEGHIVVAYGKKTIRDIGVINSAYWYDDSERGRFHDDYTYVHRKGVKWLNLFEQPKFVSGKLLEALQKPSGTLHEIKSSRAKKIIARYVVKAGYFLVESMDGLSVLLSEERYLKDSEAEEIESRDLSDAELEDRVKAVDRQARKVLTYSSRYSRNPNVAEYAKRRAKGKCDLCGDAAPFHTVYDEPFLESHHIVGLADGGEDSVRNTVALCPNCHRKVHSLKLEEDVKKLETRTSTHIA